MRRPLALVATVAVTLSILAGTSFAVPTGIVVAAPAKLDSSSGETVSYTTMDSQGSVVYSRYDLNRDTFVDLLDLAVLAVNYGGRDTGYDLNGDNLIDLYDLVGLARQLFLAEDKVITSHAIAGVTAPVTGETPVTTATDTTEYTAVVVWVPADGTFSDGTEYTATITIVPRAGYTLTGVPANYFTVAGASATNVADSGVVTAVFPAASAKQRLGATGFRVNLITGSVSGNITDGTQGSIDLSGLPGEAMIVSVTFDAPLGSTLDLISLSTSTIGSIPMIRHLDTLTVTMDDLLGGLHDGAISLKTLRDFLGSTVTMTGTASHPDYLSADVALAVILE